MLFWHLLFVYFVYHLGLIGFFLFFVFLLDYYYYKFIDTNVEYIYINEDINIPDQDIDADTHIDDLYYIVCLKYNKTIAVYYYTNKYIELKLEPSYDLLNKYHVIKTYNYLDKYYKKPYIMIQNKLIMWYIKRSLQTNINKMKTN